MLKSERTILFLWGVSLILLRVSLLLPHRELDWIALVNSGLQILLAFLSLATFLKTRSPRRFVLLNFSFFFAFSIPLFISPFVGGSLFSTIKNASFYYHFYVNKIGLNFFFLFPVCYTLMDFFFDKMHVVTKYMYSSAIAGTIVMTLFSSWLLDPLTLRNVPMYASYDRLRTLSVSMQKHLGRRPSSDEIRKSWVEAGNTGTARLEQVNGAEIDFLLPYLEGSGATVLFWRPVELRCIYAEAAVLVLIAAFLGASYVSSRSYSAYFDKLLILFFALTLFEMVHRIAYIQATSQTTYLNIFWIGEYFSVAILAVLAYALDLRLRFSSSVTGRFYEAALEHSPGMITRWRDELDNWILRVFTREKSSSHHVGY